MKKMIYENIKWGQIGNTCDDGFTEKFVSINRKIKTFCDEKVPKHMTFLNILYNEYVVDNDMQNFIKSSISTNKRIEAIKNVICFSNENEALIYLKYDHGYDDCEFIGYIKNDFFLLMPMHCGHPEIVTNNFLYSNSDGSGPDIFNDSEILTSHKMIDRIKELFCEFTSNMYH